ncbi:hypothetical protein J437_LFUL004401 [Ladona fulva]|uniref:Uncharacterized protein n=1 Tax=Ladona fulva TaxID=123851 RepID=A0A8K0K1U7_LADFU|nr:hypothetical protein J437_LFUL004401 [Ladona fulva]
MSNLFIDFQACIDDDWIVRPPFSNEYLGKKAKKQNAWLETYHHGIIWDEGYISYPALSNILYNICRYYKQIYAKGLEKSLYLPNLLRVAVIDLDTVGCPSLKKLNTNAPRSALRTNKAFQDINTGVYAADTLPIHAQRPCAFIANTDPKNKPDEHWVAFFIDGNGVCEYFDSFGRPPIIGHHKMFIKRNSYRCVYNNFPLQSLISTDESIRGRGTGFEPRDVVRVTTSTA